MVSKISATQIVAASKLLAEHLVKRTDDSGLWDYNDDWSDVKIAKEIGIKGDQIAHLRLQLHGKIGHSRIDNEVITTLRAELSALRAAHQRLETDFRNLANLHAKLCENISINKILNVQHLRGTTTTELKVAR